MRNPTSYVLSRSSGIAGLLLALGKGLSTELVCGLKVRELLPSAYNGVDIGRVEFHAAANPAGSLRGNNRRSASQEWIEDEIATHRAVHDGVRHERDRLHGGM